MSSDLTTVLDEVTSQLAREKEYRFRQIRDAYLAALSAAGIRCLYVPEGVEVEHGARLVVVRADAGLFAIEATP